uniref:U7-theraphotoxin-Cg1a n=1 Tax=Chilobrachys guangxiensis TaxID=278060 RepID=JZTX2_CHIGU|nr:RecName: Full=U7-theraphotoxin-Cg1a; Short=U7-TRTX-Cg1a; AltName: Full=Jingzhaotoxin-2; Short=JZTX-2; AltName: Full=Peptide F2-32.19; Flags: Precursor [Chilobrachys guangxiensis]ABY71669.1 cystine knot toxin [Chilobrachys guangxiensis]
MKTSILFVIFGLALLFALSVAIEMEEEETDRGCGTMWSPCSTEKPCCDNFSCQPAIKWCIWSP